MEKKILITKSTRFLVGKILQEFSKINFTVSSASDEVEAIIMAKTERPDLIILDVLRSQIDLKSISRIRGLSDLADIPILLLISEHIAKEDIVTAMQAGATDIILKPFKMSVLIQKVSKILGVLKNVD